MNLRFLVLGLLCLWSSFGTAQTLPNPIMFCTQIPNPSGFATSMETFGNQPASMYAAPRGGDLYIRYTDGTLKNLTQAAGYGQDGMQGATAIAVRDPCVHWDGQKALFSMIVGAPTQQYQVLTFHWKIYEITGLGPNDTPVITLVPNQPDGYNNIQPIYGTDDRIIFASDRPRGGQAQLYPQFDEYESSPIVTGLWRIDPKACSPEAALEMLTHSPSGDFTPTIDHFGRVIFTRWDHLQRDQQADADIMNNTGYGTFNYLNETDTATRYPILPDIEIFPEPRSSRTDLLGLPEWANTLPQTFNIFNPWMMTEDGTELELINHIGRHEMGGNYFTQNFSNDPNLHDYSSVYAPTPHPIRAMFHIQESPVTPGLYYGTEAGEFGSHASGMILSVFAPPGTHPEQVVFTYITHPDTRSPTNNPSANHSGLYRNPVPLSDGQVLVVHTHTTDYDQNQGTSTHPISSYDYRLRLLVPVGDYFKAGASTLTGAGISKNVSWWSPDELVNYNGLLWETYPVEVRARPRPATPTLHTETVPTIEQNLFTAAGVNLNDFRKFLRRNNISLLVTRDVTSRDDADQQQPYNLKVAGSAHQTINPAHPNNIYEVKYLQYLQADQLRGMGGMADPRPGRRPIARFLHDNTAMRYNPSTSGGPGSARIQSDGSVAAIVPANRALSWQLTDSTNRGIVRERLWLSTIPGEVRVCTSCHGESTLNQAGALSPSNPPQALTALLNHVKVIDSDNDGIKDIYDAYPLDPSRHTAEPVSDDFTASLVNWVNENPDNDAVFWAPKTNIPCYSKSAVINNRATNATGKVDRLRRFIDLSNMDEAKLTFDVAYARYNASRSDRLRVLVVTCNGPEEVVYDKAGSVLATVPDQSALFTPADCSQWRNECVNLSAYAGKTVELVFENISGYGNKLYLDNIHILEDDPGIPLPVFSGETDPCILDIKTYSITSTHPPGTVFQWIVTGGTLQSGQGTTTATIKWGTGNTGAISVRIGQSCLATGTKNIRIHPLPTASITANPANGLLRCQTGVTMSTPLSNAYAYQWYKNGSLINGANAATYTATVNGTYKVVVEDTLSNCTAEASFNVIANPACNPAYCASTGTNSTKEWIKSFSVAGNTNTSGNNNGYGNFLDSYAPITLMKGVPLDFTLTPGYSSTQNTENWRVWIDFNKDGDFLDAGEQLFSVSGKNVQSMAYTIPNSKPTGATRMRVSMKRNAYATSCETFAFGEVEDYVVIINTLPPALRSAETTTEVLSIFPNPASQSVTLAFSASPEAGQVEIFNIYGERIALLRREMGSTELEMDVSDWASGIYFAKVGDLPVGRFIVQH